MTVDINEQNYYIPHEFFFIKSYNQHDEPCVKLMNIFAGPKQLLTYKTIWKA